MHGQLMFRVLHSNDAHFRSHDDGGCDPATTDENINEILKRNLSLGVSEPILLVPSASVHLAPTPNSSNVGSVRYGLVMQPEGHADIHR
jgi:hypothetical protein